MLSIIIATFNAEKVLKRCLDSIIEQKTDDIEVLIIDGGSTDSTMNIVKSYGNSIDYFLSEKDQGIYDAWNRGIKKSRGEWLLFVGADDQILPNVLHDYVEFASNVNKNTDIITAKSRFVDLNGKLIKEIGRPYLWEEYRHNMNIAHGATLHNRKLFEEIGLYNINYKICADYELLMRKGVSIKGDFFDKVIMNFVVGGASFSYRCQCETYMIRNKYKSVSLLKNVFLFVKRCSGITLNRIIYKTHE